jgi:hypothetical protein
MLNSRSGFDASIQPTYGGNNIHCTSLAPAPSNSVVVADPSTVSLGNQIASLVTPSATKFLYIHTAFQVHWEASDVSELTVWTAGGGPTGAVTRAPDPAKYPYTDPPVLTIASTDAKYILYYGDGTRIDVSMASRLLLLLLMVVSMVQSL